MDGGGGDSWSVPLVGPEEGVDWQLSEIVCRSALRPGRSHDESLLIMYVPSVVFFSPLSCSLFLVLSVQCQCISWGDEFVPSAGYYSRGTCDEDVTLGLFGVVPH